MMIGINCGHTLEGPGAGAVGMIVESKHTRLVGNILMKRLVDAGVGVVNCTVDRAVSQEAYLEKAVQTANQSALELFISIHFNASKEHKAQGTEVYTYRGEKHPIATAICSHLEKLGFSNRGVKDGSGLYVIRRTKARAILIEVCFCDNEKDVAIYKRMGSHDAVAHAIYEALCENVIKGKGQGENGKEVFMDFVGSIAARDWHTRRIILPSVVVAQAIKESAWGTSELARKANALFGIKRNGWNGRIYVKDALEQNADGTYDTVKQTQWRAYDGWEESVLDHNTYIAERSTDGGRTLRYAPVIGCADYTLAARHLQECGYATALGYAESLVYDYIEKYQLTKFDS
ncbi:MAG: N-acetylmuramoyl-L-alanine amidase [Lachnospiraceae bacterium]|nr:N-acetylmuramoyl-L-alanine amidase [Lachnospiraceae bacterium]